MEGFLFPHENDIILKACSHWELFAAAPSVGNSRIHHFGHWSRPRKQLEIIRGLEKKLTVTEEKQEVTRKFGALDVIQHKPCDSDTLLISLYLNSERYSLLSEPRL